MNTKDIGGALEVDTDKAFLRHLFVYHPALYRAKDKTIQDKRDCHADLHTYGRKH